MLPTALFGSLGFVGLSLFTFLLYAALGDRMGGLLHALQLTTAIPK